SNATTCAESCPAGWYVSGTVTDPGCVGNLKVQCAKVQGNALDTCQWDCPAGYTATAVRDLIPQCNGGLFAGIQTTCTRVSGPTVETCEDHCPDGYHATAVADFVSACAIRYHGVETICAQTGGAPFTTCGPQCPDGWYATSVDYPIPQCSIAFGSMQAHCSKIGGTSITTCGVGCPTGWFAGDTTSNPSCGPVYGNVQTQCFKNNPLAPQITRQPQPVSIVAGQSATLSAGASGQTPLLYQWYTGASGDRSKPIAQGIAAQITVSPQTTTSYWVLVSNSAGEASSNTATVTVTPACVAPAISAQPQGAHVAAGGSATLSITATGTSLAYQWYQGSSGNTSAPVSGGNGVT
ncbi:MAG TPA: hypothetical protein VKJ07_09180, partial [Mycobacteriales bacterium]|nr:hypothetical protein [Mycobacteriales bacterium]